jgi:hypothetical protein
MRASRRTWFTFAAVAAVLATAACKKPAPPPQDESAAAPAPAPPAAPKEFSVSGIEVGKGLGADKKVATPTTTFAPRDTIYASVTTDGAAPSKVITAKWTFQSGQTVKEESDTIAPTGPASTEFHITKKSGWPVGKYKVEILVDGSSAGTKDFEVKK